MPNLSVKNLLSRTLHRIVICSLLIVGVLFSSVAPALADNRADQSQQRGLPLVFVRDIEIHEAQNEAVISGTFRTISREPSSVGGVDYIIMLLSPSPEIPEGQLVGDNPIIYSREYVSAKIALGPEGEQIVPFSYTLPPLPQGETGYRIRIQLVTSNGRGLGWWDRDVTLSGTLPAYAAIESLLILADSTDPMVARFMREIEAGTLEAYEVEHQDIADDTTEEDTLHRSEWFPLEGPNVDPRTEVGLRATFTNLGSSPLNGTLVASYRRDLISTSQAETAVLGSISLDPNETRTQDIAFSAPEIPGAYQVFLRIEDEHGNPISAEGEYRIVVRGLSASIVNVFADELRLGKGDSVLISTTIAGPADRETELRGILEVIMLDDNVPVGSETSEFDLKDHALPRADARIVLDRDITGTPSARVILRDERGSELDSYTVAFPRDAALSSDAPDTNKFASARASLTILSGTTGPTLALLGVLLVLAFGVLVYLMIKRRREGKGFVRIFLFALLLAGGVATVGGSVEGSHWRELGFPDDQLKSWVTKEATGIQLLWPEVGNIVFTINSPVPGVDVFAPGDTISYQASAAFDAYCGNTYANTWWWLHLSEGGVIHTTHDIGPKVPGGTHQGWDQRAYLGTEHHASGAARWTRAVTGNITVEEQHMDSEGRFTLWSELWLDVVTGGGTKHYVVSLYLHTHFAINRITIEARNESNAPIGGVQMPGWEWDPDMPNPDTGDLGWWVAITPNPISTTHTFTSPERIYWITVVAPLFLADGRMFLTWENCYARDNQGLRHCGNWMNGGGLHTSTARYVVPTPLEVLMKDNQGNDINNVTMEGHRWNQDWEGWEYVSVQPPGSRFVYVPRTTWVSMYAPSIPGREFDYWEGECYRDPSADPPIPPTHCGGGVIHGAPTRTITAYYKNKNALTVNALVNGVTPLTGVQVWRVNGSMGVAGTTNYTIPDREGDINATLEVPESHNGVPFNQWDGCENYTLGSRQCWTGNITGGAHPIFTAYYGSIPLNALSVYAVVDGILTHGVVMGYVSGDNVAGETNYTIPGRPKSIDGTIQAPDAHGGKLFSNWDGCENYISGTQCWTGIITGGNHPILYALYGETPPNTVIIKAVDKDGNSLIGVPVEAWREDSIGSGTQLTSLGVENTERTIGPVSYPLGVLMTIDEEYDDGTDTYKFEDWGNTCLNSTKTTCRTTAVGGEVRTVTAVYKLQSATQPPQPPPSLLQYEEGL